MKVYLVENSYGSYDSTHTSIDKIFDTKEKADKYVTEVEDRIKELKKFYSNMSHKNKTDEHDIIYDKAVEKFDVDFPDTYYDSWDGNYFTIKELGVE